MAFKADIPAKYKREDFVPDPDQRANHILHKPSNTVFSVDEETAKHVLDAAPKKSRTNAGITEDWENENAEAIAVEQEELAKQKAAYAVYEAMTTPQLVEHAKSIGMKVPEGTENDRASLLATIEDYQASKRLIAEKHSNARK